MKREDAVRYGSVIVFTLSQEKISAEKTCNYHIYYLTTSYYNTKTSIHHKAFIKLTTCGKHSSLYLLTTNPSIHPNSNKHSSVASKKLKSIFAHIPHPQFALNFKKELLPVVTSVGGPHVQSSNSLS